MPRFMLDRTVQAPPGYAERGCALVSYRLPLLAHCFVLCHETSLVQPDATRNELLQFFISEAGRLAEQAVGDREAFMLIHSGRSVRKRANWHLHVFVVQRRWQKAWVYAILAFKNMALCFHHGLARVLPWRNKPSLQQAIKRHE